MKTLEEIQRHLTEITLSPITIVSRFPDMPINHTVYANSNNLLFSFYNDFVCYASTSIVTYMSMADAKQFLFDCFDTKIAISSSMYKPIYTDEQKLEYRMLYFS